MLFNDRLEQCCWVWVGQGALSNSGGKKKARPWMYVGVFNRLSYSLLWHSGCKMLQGNPLASQSGLLKEGTHQALATLFGQSAWFVGPCVAQHKDHKARLGKRTSLAINIFLRTSTLTPCSSAPLAPSHLIPLNIRGAHASLGSGTKTSCSRSGRNRSVMYNATGRNTGSRTPLCQSTCASAARNEELHAAGVLWVSASGSSADIRNNSKTRFTH